MCVCLDGGIVSHNNNTHSIQWPLGVRIWFAWGRESASFPVGVMFCVGVGGWVHTFVVYDVECYFMVCVCMCVCL